MKKTKIPPIRTNRFYTPLFLEYTTIYTAHISKYTTFYTPHNFKIHHTQFEPLETDHYPTGHSETTETNQHSVHSNHSDYAWYSGYVLQAQNAQI